MSKMKQWCREHPGIMQFLMFFIISNGVTILQLILMPLLKGMFEHTALVNIDFRVLPIGSNVDGSRYYIFDYSAGSLRDGFGGGLAYFLSVQITLLIAQIINFFLQRNVTFKSKSNIKKAAVWYVIAYIVITFIAAAAQGIYKQPIYHLFMEVWQMGKTGETIADVLTMIINSAISFWVFFPIFKVIFKEKGKNKENNA